MSMSVLNSSVLGQGDCHGCGEQPELSWQFGKHHDITIKTLDWSIGDHVRKYFFCSEQCAEENCRCQVCGQPLTKEIYRRDYFNHEEHYCKNCLRKEKIAEQL